MSLSNLSSRSAKIRMAVLTVAATALTSVAAHSANADVIANYTFSGSVLTPAVISPVGITAASTVTSINGTAFTFPTSPTTTSGTPSASLASFFSSSGSPAVITPTGNGFALTLTIDPGYTLDLSTISFFDQVSATGPSTGTVLINGSSAGFVTNTIAITQFSVPVNLTGLTGTVSFNLVGGGTSAGFASNGTSVAGSGGTFRIDDLTFNGTLTPVATTPEPASIGIAAAGAVMLLGRRRRAAK